MSIKIFKNYGNRFSYPHDFAIGGLLGVVEFFFRENQNLRPANLFLMPLETRTQKIKILQ